MRQRVLMIVLTLTFGALLLACGGNPPLIPAGPPEGKGADAPAELLDRYRDLHARKDTAPLGDLELWYPWSRDDRKPEVVTAGHEQGWKDLFALELVAARIDEMPPEPAQEVQSRRAIPGPQYFARDHDGEARFVVCQMDDRWDGAHGKLLLIVREPGGSRSIDIDPGVAVVRWGGRYFLRPLDEVLRDAVDAVRAGRSLRFRAVPLGINLQGLAGWSPRWERVERLLEAAILERAGRITPVRLPGGNAGPPP